MSELKQKQVFSERAMHSDEERVSPELTAQKTFSEKETFVPVAIEEQQEETEQELQLEQVIRPNSGRKWLTTGLFLSLIHI